jgi:hypothetical protein
MSCYVNKICIFEKHITNFLFIMIYKYMNLQEHLEMQRICSNKTVARDTYATPSTSNYQPSLLSN